MATEGPTPISRETKLALVAMGLSVIVIANDFSAMNVALPSIEKDFDTGITTAQWVINAYALTFGVLIVTGGRLADIFGRRNAFFAGTAIFASMSALGGASQTESMLIVTRTLMGIGGALMWPAILGMTFGALPEERQGLAGGLIIGAAGLGNALGPLIGGFMTQELSWRFVLYLNVPIALFAVAVVYRTIAPDGESEEDKHIDYTGVALISTGLVALLVALDQVSDWGIGDPRIIVMLILAVVLVGSFTALERKLGDRALVPGDVMRNRNFLGSCLGVLFMSATFFASLLYLPQFMQERLDYSALEAGVGMLPFLAVFALTSFVAGPLYNRVGAKPLAVAGAIGISAAPVIFSLIDSSSGYGALPLGMVCLGVGIGLFYPTATTAGVTSVDESRSSLAGGILYMFQIAGGSIGLGLTTTVFAAAGSFTEGLQNAFRLDAALALVGLFVAVTLIGDQEDLLQVEESASS